MCTAITYQPRELYMGRSLDYEASYGEEIVMLPRRFPLRFRHGGGSEQGYAILGTAHVADGYPLYYDAVNEKGLGIAGLNFVGNAHYAAPQDGRQNVAQFEFIPWLLRQCATLAPPPSCTGCSRTRPAPSRWSRLPRGCRSTKILSAC